MSYCVVISQTSKHNKPGCRVPKAGAHWSSMKEREGISERLRWKPDGRFAQLDCEQYIHVSKYHARFLAILQSQVITWVET